MNDVHADDDDDDDDDDDSHENDHNDDDDRDDGDLSERESVGLPFAVKDGRRAAHKQSLISPPSLLTLLLFLMTMIIIVMAIISVIDHPNNDRQDPIQLL